MQETVHLKDEWRRLSTGLLVIQTVHPETVKELLLRFDLALEAWFEAHKEGYVYVRYPPEMQLMSLALCFWLGAAQTCGLIERWIQ